MAAAKKNDHWNAQEEWNKIWLEQQDWLEEQETAFQNRIDDLRAQIQKKYDARLEKAFKLVAGKHEDRIAALRECHSDFVAWQSADDAKLDKVIDKAISAYHKKEQAAERKKAKALKEKEKARKQKAKQKKAKK